MSTPTVCAAILTGGRADLLERTLEAAEDVLTVCDRVVALNNGNDPATARALNRSEFFIADVQTTDQRLPNGAAMSMLAQMATGTGCDLTLAIEDDWILSPDLVAAFPDWWERACALAMIPIVGQVRLRRATDLAFCASSNWVDGLPVVWTPIDGEPAMIGNAHWTQNPSLVRTELLYGEEHPGEPTAGVYPAQNERHAMARWHSFNLRSVQMLGGVFDHIGWDRSLEGH